MDYVYQHATVTIASEASPISSIGIENSTKPFRCPSSMLPWALVRCESKSLQGKIYFRGHETLWETVQHFPTFDPDYEIVPSGYMRKAVLDFWYTNIVNHYVARQVTYPSDRLMALRGITREIQKHLLEPKFIAGIWAADIHSGLAWFPPVANAKAYPAYDAPSWSWAQLDYGAIYGVVCHLYNDRLTTNMTLLAEISIEEPKPVNEFGSASGTTKLNMRSQCLPVCACKSVPVFYLQLLRYEPNPRKPNWSDEFHTPVIVALIVKECGNKLNPEYQRVGRALIPTDPSRPFSWPVQELKIV
ncbi:hypothetical protein LTS10_008021 [Elasticomyces elasticus]|nr:hypothetical protein LTS10_008021 [Elasticomyces elasticus]